MDMRNDFSERYIFKSEENKLKFASNVQAFFFPAIMKNCRRKCRWRSESVYWVLSSRFVFLSSSKSSCRHFITWFASKRLPWNEIFRSVWTFIHHASTDVKVDQVALFYRGFLLNFFINFSSGQFIPCFITHNTFLEDNKLQYFHILTMSLYIIKVLFIHQMMH